MLYFVTSSLLLASVVVGFTSVLLRQCLHGTSSCAQRGQGKDEPPLSPFLVIITTVITRLPADLAGRPGTLASLAGRLIKLEFTLRPERMGQPAASIAQGFGVGMEHRPPPFPLQQSLEASGVAAIGVITALGGVAQSFTQFVGTRVFLAAGGSAHAPRVRSRFRNS